MFPVGGFFHDKSTAFECSIVQGSEDETVEVKRVT